MNSKSIIALAGTFLAGAAAGAFGTFLYMKKAYCDKKIEEGIEDYILNRYNPDGTVKEGSDSKSYDGDNDTSEDNFDPASHSSSVPKYMTPDTDRTKYDEFFEKKSPQEVLAEREHPLDSDEDDEDNEVLENLTEEEQEVYLDGLSKSVEHASYVKGEMPAVEIITEDEYGHNPEYDDDVLVYWLGDDILTNEVEEVCFDQLKDSLCDADVFTDSWIDLAQKDVNADEARLFVRHHEFMKDYMILPEERAYYESH